MCGSQTLEQELVKLKLPWRSQDVRNARAVGYMLRRAANGDWDQTWRKSCVPVNKDERRVGDLKISLTLDMEMQSLEFVQLVSCLALGIAVK